MCHVIRLLCRVTTTSLWLTKHIYRVQDFASVCQKNATTGWECDVHRCNNKASECIWKWIDWMSSGSLSFAHWLSFLYPEAVNDSNKGNMGIASCSLCFLQQQLLKMFELGLYKLLPCKISGFVRARDSKHQLFQVSYFAFSRHVKSIGVSYVEILRMW